VSRLARVGVQRAFVVMLVNRVPLWASRSRCGVAISEPKLPRSEKPMSSATTRTTLGRRDTREEVVLDI
jgi:hypothetical protein